MKSTVGIIAGFLIIACVIFIFAIPAAERREQEADDNLKFTGACEYLGGRVASFDEGETLICIKAGKVVLR